MPAGASGEEAWVSLGSNLGDRAGHLAHALRRLGQLPATRLIELSPVYETAPIGPPPQGPFLNAVVRLRTALPPRDLLTAMLAIEDAAGRARGRERWSARTLDLDLLLYGDRRMDQPELVLPHPRLAERPFVLEPLAALAPELLHPELGVTIAALAERVRNPRAVRHWDGDDAVLRALVDYSAASDSEIVNLPSERRSRKLPRRPGGRREDEEA
jgi:2-amino-4-hydroxy-6-hydroxymethyldihydropteridine diphosphokinase